MENHNKLDVAAKLFPAVTTKNNSSVFRVAVVLKEAIDARILQLAVNMIYERYNLFFRRLRHGFFWNYFDSNHIHFTVEEENAAPCSTIISHENKGYIIKVLYFGNRISVEAFHSITDGGGVAEFFKSLTYYYLTIKHGNIDPQGKILLYDEECEESNEDSFVKHFSKMPKIKTEKVTKQQTAYRIKGKKFKKGGHRAITGIISVSALKKESKLYGCTITSYLVAHLIMSIYEAKQKSTKNKRPIIVCVPVNLRKIFPSATLKNFFGVVNLGLEMSESVTFKDVVAAISEQLNISMDEQNLKNASHQNVKISDNVLTRHTPLILKNLILPFGFNFMGETKKSITLSNIGMLDFPSGVREYIEHVEILLYPTPKSPINCSVCSFEDKLSISFSCSIKDTSVMREFFTSLISRAGTDVAVYSNMWGRQNEQM